MDKSVLELVQEYREQMAESINRSVARLYSHHARLSQEQDGLRSWSEYESSERLDDAVRLIEAAFVELEQSGGDSESWTLSMRRAGEILEWLSHPKIGLSEKPIRLLSSAAYQLAGYPARSTGLLSLEASMMSESQVLKQYLQADFRGLLFGLVEYWTRLQMSGITERVEQRTEAWSEDLGAFSEWAHQLVVGSTLSAFGVLVAEMRWGNEQRVDKAIEKLLAVSKLLLHSNDPYSWLLAKMSAMVSSTYKNSSLRHHLRDLSLNERGLEMLERYLRQSYLLSKSLAWPSQRRGIERLKEGESFALCTPTGSGKTTVAEVAILQGLFPDIEGTSNDNSDAESLSPIVIYLVPSRALATEVEYKLSQVFESLSSEEAPIIVTGLYGGSDWGPTDAWLTRDTPTVLICTYEKAEALIRFMGSLFLNRVSLVIVDEAHLIQFEKERSEYEKLRKAESRSLRLEVLTTRLFSIVERNRGRIIALSAVAEGIESELANWAAGESDSLPAKSLYRSTRQMIGYLHCENRRFRIVYDLLDRSRLILDNSISSERAAPYVPNPFPPHPPAPGWEPIQAEQLSLLPRMVSPQQPEPKPEKHRRPYLFWAAMQLAAIRENEQQRAVLVSVPQRPGGYAKDFLDLLDLWKNQQLPSFFELPGDDEKEKQELWNRCLASCEDYFGKHSREYRLLENGVVVHHGKMPGLLARLLVEVIQKRIVGLVIATSTLTAGVNLPFEVVLIPSLRRGPANLSVRELGNLMGRAGRPGYGTEGRSLVLVSSPVDRRRYQRIIAQLQSDGGSRDKPASPLAELIFHLYVQWQELVKDNQLTAFLQWLEHTSPLSESFDGTAQSPAIDTLDTLDGVLLAAVVELESIAQIEFSTTEVEARLKEIWQRSYARFAKSIEFDLERVFTERGKAIVNQIYPSRTQRKQLYSTCLPPRSGSRLLDLKAEIQEYLETGTEYGRWNRHERFEYIKGVVERIADIEKFSPDSKTPEKTEWSEVLHWWLDRDWVFDTDERSALSGLRIKTPSTERVAEWHGYIQENFIYRLNWGIGSFIAVRMNEVYELQESFPFIDEWPGTGLPWIVFWLKELITWGTLEPVAAYLLARGRGKIATRADAQRRALGYYEEQPAYASADELLNAESIRRWARAVLDISSHKSGRQIPLRGNQAALYRDFSNAGSRTWRVLPSTEGEEILWYDPAGFLLAKSERPDDWQPEWIDSMDFFLDHARKLILSRPYL